MSRSLLDNKNRGAPCMTKPLLWKTILKALLLRAAQSSWIWFIARCHACLQPLNVYDWCISRGSNLTELELPWRYQRCFSCIYITHYVLIQTAVLNMPIHSALQSQLALTKGIKVKCCERLHVMFYKYKQFLNVVIYANLQLQQYVMLHIELCPKYAADSRSFNDFNFLPVLGALWAADLIRAFQGLNRDGIHSSANLG